MEQYSELKEIELLFVQIKQFFLDMLDDIPKRMPESVKNCISNDFSRILSNYLELMEKWN